MPWGAVVGGVLAAGGSMMQGNAASKGAKDAAGAQLEGQREALAAQERAQRTASNLLSPYENQGYAAGNKLNYLLGLSSGTIGLPPTIEKFKYVDSRGNKVTDEVGFQQALAHWKQNAGMLLGEQYPTRSAYQKPVYNKAGKLTGYKLDKQAWKQAVNEYKVKVQNFEKGRDQQGSQPGSLPNGDKHGSLMQDYTPEMYKEDPGYTPMVNDLESLQATPGYQFRLQQGEQSVNRGAAAKGGLLSGATQKALTEFGQGLASTEYQHAWQRGQAAYQSAFDRYNTNRTNKFNMLNTVAGRGQNAANSMAGIATNAGNNISTIAQNNASALGNIYAANAQAQGNMWGNLANTASNTGTNYALANGWGSGNQNDAYAPGGAYGPMNPTTQS